MASEFDKARGALCDGRQWHVLSLNVSWLNKGLHEATAYCVNCGKHFECKEFVVETRED